MEKICFFRDGGNMNIKLKARELNLAKNDKPEKMVIFLHGVGSDANDLIDLAENFSVIFPKAVFLSPNAPFPYDLYPMGYQWFSLKDRSSSSMIQGIEIAIPILQNYIEENLAKYGLNFYDLILVGFSQGAMMALQIAPRFKESCFAVVGFSGALINMKGLIREKKSNPPICLIHGDKDEVVTIDNHFASVNALRSLGLLKEEYVIKNMGHSINFEALAKAIKFLTMLKD